MNTHRRTSIRLRLTLWNIGVVTLLLLGLGATLRYALQASLIGSVDRSLNRVGHEVQGRIASNSNPPGPFPQLIVGPNGLMVKTGSSLPPPPDNGPNGFHLQIWDTHRQSLLPRNPSAPYDETSYQRSLAGQQVFSTVHSGADALRVDSLPLRRSDHIVGVVQIPRPLTETYQEVHRLTGILLLLALPAVLLAGLGGAFLTTRALRPIQAITQAAGRIEAEDLSRRLRVSGRDELSELSETFNGMLTRLENAFGEREAAYSRLEQVNTRLEEANERQRRFTADASHELKTPLTVIEGTVSLSLSEERSAGQYRQALETVGRSTGMMKRIVEDLLLLARSDAGELGLELRRVSLGDVLALAREAISGREHPPIEIQETDPPITIEGDPNHLVRLFVNLLDNAVRHSDLDKPISVTIVSEGEWVLVTIQDHGAGIAPEHLPHVFERFYRVDAARSRRHGGTGLGLAICQSIVEAHGGTMAIESVPGAGTRVTVKLSIYKQA